MTTPMTWPEAVKHDRKVRRRMSRKEYATHVGLTESRIAGAETGRKIRQDSIEALLPHVGDLLPVELGGTLAPTGPGDYVMPEGGPTTDGGPLGLDGIESLADYQAAREKLITDYETVKARLGGKPAPPIGLPAGGNPMTCRPGEMSRWAEWVRKVSEHLDTIGVPPLVGAPVDIGPGVDLAPEWFVPVDLTGDEDDDLLTVNSATITVTNENGSVSYPVNMSGPSVPMSDLEVQLAQSISATRNGSEPDPDTVPPDVDKMEVAQVLRFPGVHDDRRQPKARELPDKVTLDPDLRYLTNGETQTFKDCRRRWWLENYRKLGTVIEKRHGVAAVGTRFHACVAVLYVPDGDDPGDPFQELKWTVADDKHYYDNINAPEHLYKELQKEEDLVHAMLEGYVAWLEETAADRNLKVLSVETPLVANPAFPELPDVRLLTKEDIRVLRDEDKARLFLDTKTVANFDQLTVWAHMNPQMLHYDLAEYLVLVEEAMTAGNTNPGETGSVQRTAGAILNMARRVKRSGSAKPPFFARQTIHHSTETLRSYWWQLKGTIEQIIDATQRLDAGARHQEVCPPRPSSDCSWKCQFFDVCSLYDDGSDTTRYEEQVLIQIDPLKRYNPDVARLVE